MGSVRYHRFGLEFRKALLRRWRHHREAPAPLQLGTAALPAVPGSPQAHAEFEQRIFRELRPINVAMQLYGAFALLLTHWLSATAVDVGKPAMLAVYGMLAAGLAVSFAWPCRSGMRIGSFLCLLAVLLGLKILMLQLPNPAFWAIPLALVLTLSSAIAYDHLGEYLLCNLMCWATLSGGGLVDNGHADQQARIALLMASGFALGIATNIGITLSRRRSHRLNQHLAYQAHVDVLTGIRNRRSFLECVAIDMEARPFVERYCLMVDVDDFKRINDDFGHPAGDTVLVGVANVLSQNCQTCHLGRIGGEEFAVVVTDLNSDAVLAFTQTLIRQVHRLTIQGRPVSISVGVARCPPALPLSRAMQRADQALYEAKRAGKNRLAAEPPAIGAVV